MIKGLTDGIEGLVSIAIHAPGQAVRTFAALPPDERQAILGDDMSNYYFGNPQLFKMPAMGAFKEGTFRKALPFIAGGIALIVAYNMFVKKGR